MNLLTSVNFTPGKTCRCASFFWRLGLLLAVLLFLLPSLAPLALVSPVQADEVGMVVLPDFVGQVKTLRFYPSDYGFKSFYERKYSAQFPGTSTKHINWELVLDHPFKRASRVNFTINALLYGPDGKKLAESASEAWIESGMNTSQHSETFGADKPGYWKPGNYKVVLQIGGKDVATGSFQVEGATVTPTPPGPTPPGPTASGLAAFDNLNATVTGIKFFGGPTTGVAYGQRQYTDKFDAATATFIFWEVALEYPGTRDNIAEFPITAIWYDPSGKIMTTQTANAKVQGDWDSSVHSYGYGSATPGAWTPGNYQVVLKVGDRTLITGNFQVQSTTTQKAGDFLTRYNAKVKMLRFFESGKTLPAYGQRNYVEKFVGNATRYINWELSLDLSQGKRTERVNFPLSAVWYDPDGKVLTTQTRNAYFEPDWGDSWHTSGYGGETPGTFKPGVYRVVVKIEGQEVAQGSFQVLAAAAAPEKDFLSSINAQVTGVKFYEGKDGYIPVDQRQYAETFSTATARFMYVDLLLDINGTRTEEVTFAMEVLWYGPDGQLFTTTKKTGRIAADWPASVHAMGYGWDDPGHWKPGTYRVVIKIEGKEVGSGKFQMN